MANSATIMSIVDEDPIKKGQVVQTKLVLDQTNTDQVTHAPNTGFSVYLKGWLGVETSAANLKFKQRSVSAKTGTVATTSGSTTIHGTGTAFDTEYSTGDEMVISSGSTITISTIGGPTTITAVSSASSTVAGKAHYQQQTIVTPELAASQGALIPVKWRSWILATKKNYSLVVSTSVAISEMLLLTQEGATSA